ncbi:MAG: DUF1684 domain-containing protein [candidate division KSB1 bacterium]|nr:DUF1684 domain-containing protein [candidate division KSB1 bacterium]
MTTIIPSCEFRRMRDRRFKTARDSPIPPEARRQYQGLVYFPINPRMRFSVRLHRLQPADTVWIMTTHGRDRPALKIGYFEFAMHQKSYRLFAYVFLDGSLLRAAFVHSVPRCDFW